MVNEGQMKLQSAVGEISNKNRWKSTDGSVKIQPCHWVKFKMLFCGLCPMAVRMRLPTEAGWLYIGTVTSAVPKETQ